MKPWDIPPDVSPSDLEMFGLSADGQRLVTCVPGLCMVTGGMLTPDERQVVKALSPHELRAHHPAAKDDQRDITINALDAATVLTSSISFRVPVEPVDMLREANPAPRLLPRPPYPVTLFEMYDEDGDHNRFTGWDDQDGLNEVVAVSIAETEPGREWLVWTFVTIGGQKIPGSALSSGRFTCLGYKLRVIDDRIHSFPGGPVDDGSWLLTSVAACCQLSTARGAVTTEHRSVSRQVRRAHDRHIGFKQPKIYRLDIGSGSAEPDEREGNRVYTCRWLVHGHWRNIGGGRTTYVRPYLKGPLGAPFKGRPQYTVVGREE